MFERNCIVLKFNKLINSHEYILKQCLLHRNEVPIDNIRSIFRIHVNVYIRLSCLTFSKIRKIYKSINQ